VHDHANVGLVDAHAEPGLNAWSAPPTWNSHREEYSRDRSDDDAVPRKEPFLHVFALVGGHPRMVSASFEFVRVGKLHRQLVRVLLNRNVHDGGAVAASLQDGDERRNFRLVTGAWLNQERKTVLRGTESLLSRAYSGPSLDA
jgi:hypothetical protein